MITVSEKLIVTKQVNEVVCRYAKEVIVRNFLYEFAFPNCSKTISELNIERVNPLLETLNYYQGDFNPDTLYEVNEFIFDYIKKFDENEFTALYYLTLNENYFRYSDDLENELPNRINKFEKKLGRELAYKIFEPESSELFEDVIEMLKNKISRLAGELDLSLITQESIEEILEAIDSIVS